MNRITASISGGGDAQVITSPRMCSARIHGETAGVMASAVIANGVEIISVCMVTQYLVDPCFIGTVTVADGKPVFLPAFTCCVCSKTMAHAERAHNDVDLCQACFAEISAKVDKEEVEHEDIP